MLTSASPCAVISSRWAIAWLIWVCPRRLIRPQSNGRMINCAQAALPPVRTVPSGPSTGVIGAQEAGRLAGFSDLIKFGMGGTSTDVALRAGGRAVRSGQ